MVKVYVYGVLYNSDIFVTNRVPTRWYYEIRTSRRDPDYHQALLLDEFEITGRYANLDTLVETINNIKSRSVTIEMAKTTRRGSVTAIILSVPKRSYGEMAAYDRYILPIIEYAQFILNPSSLYQHAAKISASLPYKRLHENLPTKIRQQLRQSPSRSRSRSR
jgi:hypothetical protein